MSQIALENSSTISSTFILLIPKIFAILYSEEDGRAKRVTAILFSKLMAEREKAFPSLKAAVGSPTN